MFHKYAKIAPLIVSLGFVSCDDPALVKKKGEQESEIARLTGELEIAEEKLKDLPEDRTEELLSATVVNKKLEAERQELLDEIEQIEMQETLLKEQFDTYKAKYSTEQLKPLDQ
ncbi:hypothetical protein [Luteolibacter sp. AS25]|uniref:hypothetical protein n=1 Tax=Luteolibacter sp. AS25 TaxID=3135776 RepID=UPI00398A7B31